MSLLLSSIQKNKREVDAGLQAYFDRKKVAFEQIDPTLSNLLETVRDQTLRSGKRIRPFLARKAYELSGGENEEIGLQLGIGLEILHQYFMIHDDIVDRDEERYGGDSLHVRWGKYFKEKYQKTDTHLGLSLGMIGGDLMNTLSVDMVHELPVPSTLKFNLLSMLLRTIYETTAGWQIHFFMNHQKLSEVTESQFLKGMELVSAKYTFEAPLEMGMALAEKNELFDSLKTFGFHAGMAFQIKDDILGMFGDSNTMGKPVGNDYREGKKTLLVLRAYQNGTIEQKNFLDLTLGTEIDHKTLSEARDLMVETGSLEASEQIARDHIRQAKKALEAIPQTNSRVVDVLAELADFVLEREK